MIKWKCVRWGSAAAMGGLAAILILATAMSADVLVGKNGARWEGTVTEEGDRYVLVTVGGGRMTFAKSDIAEVISSEESRGEYQRRKDQMDLSDDAQVEELAEFAATNGLVAEHEELLNEAFGVRHALAETDPEALRELATWCAGYDLGDLAKQCNREASKLEFPAKLAAAGTDVTELEGVAKWCVDRGLEEQAKQCCTQAYQIRREEAQDDAMAMAVLSNWCLLHDLEEEAAETETEAIGLAPDDEDVRRELSYSRDPDTQEWVKVNVPWEIVGAHTDSMALSGGKDIVFTGLPDGGDAYLWVTVGLPEEISDEELREFYVANAEGNSQGSLYSYINEKKALLIFSKSGSGWSADEALYLHNPQGRLPINIEVDDSDEQ